MEMIMKFKDIFREDNTINEKSVVGFASFIIMCIFATVDIVTGISGSSFEINQGIYNSFVMVTVGSFGISEIGKYFNRNSKSE